MQPNIPWEHKSKPPWDAPGTPFPTFCWPPQQKLLDKVDRGAHRETILLAQPFPPTQFMPGIKISLGSSLTTANICIELEEQGHGEGWGKHLMAITSQIRAAACSPSQVQSSSPLAQVSPALQLPQPNREAPLQITAFLESKFFPHPTTAK